MRRSLVLTREGSRHPFRASLPQPLPQPSAEPRSLAGDGSDAFQDIRGVANIYVATVVGVLAFII